MSSLIPISLDQALIFKLAVALVLGAFIGAEREMIQQRLNLHEFGGVRSFMFIALLGFLSSYLTDTFGPWLAIVLFIVLSTLLAIGYVRKSFVEQKSGITSELGAVLTFVVGVLAHMDYSLAIIVGIVTALILSVKQPLHTFVYKIKDEEFFATVEFALFAFVILPLLPNQAVDPWGILNPYEIWLLIVFILGISFVGYILTRVIGDKKGTILTGLIGGIVSSTAVTQSMSEKSKTHGKLMPLLVAATIGASSVMFIRVFVVVSTLNNNLIPLLILPVGAMLLVNTSEMIWHVWRLRTDKVKEEQSEEIITESPFKLWSAVKFGLLLIFILIVTEFAKTYFGSQGVYVAALLTGVAAIDAFMLSMIKISLHDPAFSLTAAKAITLATISNTVVKGLIPTFFGEKKFARTILRNFVLTLGVGIALVLVM